MSEKKPMPKCPYCGWEMQHLFDYPMNYCDVRFYCKHCNAMSPSARGCQTSAKSVEEALEEAYEKAMKRYEEPNRVLTLEEVMADADAENWALEWIEKKNHIYQCCPLDVTAESIIFVAVDMGIKDGIYMKKSEYGVTWRCWRRKPTKNERENTPWEDEDEDNKNRVLSLAELAVSAGTLVWIEDNNGDDEPCVHARNVTYWEYKSHRIYFDGGRTWYTDCTYGETWRCWLRKPTPEEMANTPWEEK